MTPSPACYSLIRQFESLQLQAYRDPVGIWTIGYGHTGNVKQGDFCTDVQAESWLVSDVQEAVDALLPWLTIGGAVIVVNQPQFDALCSITFNVGPGVPFDLKLNRPGRDGIVWLNKRDPQGNPRHSTLLQLCIMGRFSDAANEFLKWNHSGGMILPGLTLRREAERELFLGKVAA